jgi:hypothetical protein
VLAWPPSAFKNQNRLPAGMKKADHQVGFFVGVSLDIEEKKPG